METKLYSLGIFDSVSVKEEMRAVEDFFRSFDGLSSVIWSGYPDAKGPMIEEQLKLNLQKELKLTRYQLRIATELSESKPTLLIELLHQHQKEQVHLLEDSQDLQSLDGKIAAKEFLREKQKDLESKLALYRANRHNPTLIYSLESQLSAISDAYNLISPEPVRVPDLT